MDEAGDGQCHRRPLQHGDVLRPEGGAVGAGREHDHTAPALALVLDGGGEPARRAACRRVVVGPGGSGALFPTGERLLHRASGRFADQCLVHQVLQDDRAAAHLRRRTHHVLRAGTAQGQGGERLVDALGAAHRVRLVAEQEGVHDLVGQHNENGEPVDEGHRVGSQAHRSRVETRQDRTTPRLQPQALTREIPPRRG